MNTLECARRKQTKLVKGNSESKLVKEKAFKYIPLEASNRSIVQVQSDAYAQSHRHLSFGHQPKSSTSKACTTNKKSKRKHRSYFLPSSKPPRKHKLAPQRTKNQKAQAEKTSNKSKLYNILDAEIRMSLRENLGFT